MDTWTVITTIVSNLVGAMVGALSIYAAIVRPYQAKLRQRDDALEEATKELAALRTANVIRRLEEYRNAQLSQEDRIQTLEQGGSQAALQYFQQFLTKVDFEKRAEERDDQMALVNTKLDQFLEFRGELRSMVNVHTAQINTLFKLVNGGKPQ